MVDKSVFKNSAIYTACNFLTKAFNFILLPLYTAYLTTADYGITGVIDSFRGVMMYVAIFSLQSAVVRFYVDYKDDDEQLPRYIGTIICFSFISTLCWSLLIAVLNPLLMPILFQGINFAPTLIIALVGLMFSSVVNVYQTLLQGMENARLSALLSLSNFGITAICTILFIVPFGMGANGVLLASCISGFSLTIAAIIHLKHKDLFIICIDGKILKEMLKYSIPLLPHNLSTSIAAFISSILINNTGSLTAVGIYTLASKFGTACDTLQSSVSTAYQPWLFRLLHDKVKDFKEQIRSFTEVLLWIYALVFVAVGLFIQEIILIFMADGYEEAWMLVPLIIGVYSIKTVYYFYIDILFYYKQAAKFIFIATLSSSILNVVLSFFFIPTLGAYGSVLADALAMILRVSLVIYMSKKCDDVGYRLWQFIRVTLTIFIVLGIGLFFSYTRVPYVVSIPNVLWKCSVYALFFLFVCITHKNGVRIIRRAIGSKLRHNK